jgi:hypothetical protein
MKKSTAFLLAANSLLLGFALGVLFAPEAERAMEEATKDDTDFKAKLKPLHEIQIETLQDTDEEDEI